jgi:ABC-type dipeptide/oligopeptide/nickel transport system permease component
MFTYVIRRLLLVPPTLIGITAIVFFALALAPGGIGASLLSRDAQMRPEERKVREEYLNRRYGLDRPKHVQYLHWLNKVCPISFATFTVDDPRCAEAAAAQSKQREPIENQIRELRAKMAGIKVEGDAQRAEYDQLHDQVDKLDAQRKTIRVAPQPGDVNFSHPRVKFPDLGDSFIRGRPVNDLVAEALPVSLMLQLIALPISYAMAIWLGIQQARRRGGTFDYSISGVTLALWSVPSIWVGVLLIGYFANEQYLHWFPTTGLNDLNAAAMRFLPYFGPNGFEKGWLLDRCYHIVLPVICLTYTNFAFLSRLARGSLLDNLAADFVRTARAKGLPERIVLYRHAFRNSLIPLITVIVNLLPAMVTGSVVVETIFGINGMGSMFVNAATQRDFEMLLSITLVAGVLELIAYLLGDIGYAVADPRVSYG